MKTWIPILLSALLLSNASFSQTSAPVEDRNERFRPQVHYSPERNWMNDPNGPVYFDGEYHLFYQYNPYAELPAHIGWGHAVSTDLLHWEELGVALPESDGEMVFTGSIVVDERNSSGLCATGKACLVAIYTGHGGSGPAQRETQNLAASQDRGRTWQRYAGNPVLDLKMANFRDPSVSWNEAKHNWIMVVSLPDEHEIAFFASADLKAWSRVSTFGPAGATGGQWECPNLLKVSSADSRDSVWVLKVGLNPGSLQGGSGEQYFLGDFDGTRFTQSNEAGSHGWTDYGKDSYCAISYNNLPPGKRPTLIGWMDNWQYADKTPTSPSRGQMTLPREVTLLRDQAGLSLVQQPIVGPLRQGVGARIDGELHVQREGAPIKIRTPAEITVAFPKSAKGTFGVRLYAGPKHWTEVGFDMDRMKVYVDRTHSGENISLEFPARTEAPIQSGRGSDLHLIIDRSSLEVFAQGGTISMTNLVFPPSAEVWMKGFSAKSSRHIPWKGHVWPLQPVWSVSSHRSRAK